jgi:hypothetical protein
VQGTVNLSDYDEPLKIYQKVKVRWGIVHTLIGRALSQIQDDWQKAEEDLKEAERICKELSFKPELSLIQKIYKERDPKEPHPLNFI